MEFSLNIVVDNDASNSDIAMALVVAADVYAKRMVDAVMLVDESMEHEVHAHKLQSTSFWRHA